MEKIEQVDRSICAFQERGLGSSLTLRSQRFVSFYPSFLCNIGVYLPVRRLLRHIQSTHHHMVFWVDEVGTTTGIVTLENILEPIFGSMENEFDTEQ